MRACRPTRTRRTWRRPQSIWSITSSRPVPVRQGVISVPKRLRGFLADRRRPLLLSDIRVAPPPPAGHSRTSRLVDWSQHRGYVFYDKRAHEEERHGNQQQDSIVFERARRARLNSDVSLPNPMPQWSVRDFATSIPPHARLRYWAMARPMGYPQTRLGVFPAGCFTRGIED